MGKARMKKNTKNNQCFLALKRKNLSMQLFFVDLIYSKYAKCIEFFNFRKNGTLTKEEQRGLNEKWMENSVRHIPYTLCLKHNYFKYDKVFFWRQKYFIKYVNSERTAVSNKRSGAFNFESNAGKWVFI